MNFQVLKTGFKEYLEEKNALSAKDILRDKEDVSIFMHAGEFREYLSEEFDADTSVCYKNLGELMKYEIVDGKLVDPNAPEIQGDEEYLAAIEEEKEEQEREAQALEAAENPNAQLDEMTDVQDAQPSEDLSVEDAEGSEIIDGEDVLTLDNTKEYADENGVNVQDPELITGIMNDLLNDKTFKEAIDKDGDSKIGKEDLQAFYDIIKCYDEDENTISLEDLLSAVEDINDGVFRYKTDEEYTEEIGEKETKKDTGSTPKNISSSGGGGGGVSGSYGSGGVSGSPSGATNTPSAVQKYDDNGKAIVENMTVDELKSELSTAKTDLSTKQSALEEIQNGKDSELEALETNKNNAYESYKEALKGADEELCTNVDSKKTQIDSKKAEISDNEIQISEAEVKLSEAKTNYSNLTASRQALETQLTQLKQEQGKDDSSGDISSKISTLEKEIADIKQQEETAKAAQEDAQEALDGLNANNKTLNDDLSTLNQDMTGLENQVSQQYPEIGEKYLQPYKELEGQYDTLKQQKVDAAQKEVTEAQDYINKIETAITAKETSNNITDKYSVNDGKKLIDQAYKYLGMSERQFENATGKGVPDGLWCAAFVHEMLAETRDSLPSWYENCNYNGCGSVLNAARQNNAAFTDANEAKPGDLVIFRTNRSDTGHIGIVVKIENGKVYTIEGNTSSKVGERTYDVGSQRINSFVRIPA